ncbi:exoglucanase B-like [Rhynchophorus ferrugineus]|uniref:exoglucanase B-like n=1 Tax=Rhynchophorus ferrugineus TaxID=354439 RepID=UPI003FCE7DF9
MKITLAILLVTISCINAGEFKDRFLELYNIITNKANGYYSPEGIPYHSRETLIVESIDYGHETDSEALSFNLFLQTVYGAISGDFGPFNEAWSLIEDYVIPVIQPNMDRYNPDQPTTNAEITVGSDPISRELFEAYGDHSIYGMHWLLDVDNVFGFGNVQGQCTGGPSVSGPSLINNGQGTIWQSITYPTCDNFTYGGPYGFSFYENVPYWTYSIAPDCDARIVQVALWAAQWARAQGKLSLIEESLGKISRVGDYLRYAMYDRNFKRIGDCIGKTECPAGKGKESSHYLLSWYIGWGGSLGENGWSWISSSSEAHGGYQNPVTAYALANEPTLIPKSSTGAADWATSAQRQVELYKWLQTEEGPIAGGVTNSWNNNYEEPPEDVKNYTFHGMYYAAQPGFEGSSDLVIMQAWTIDRLAQYYYASDDANAKEVLTKWIDWFYTQVRFEDTWYSVPSSFSLEGNMPHTKVTVSAEGENIGVAVATARALTFYAAKSGDAKAKETAKNLLDYIWKLNRDELGVSMTSVLTTYNQFNTKLYIPVDGWTGVYPNDIPLNASATFLDIRPWFKNDPEWYKVQTYLDGGAAPEFNYHRFFEQADLAVAYGTYAILFED